MIPFQVSAALRRLRRRHDDGWPRPARIPLWRLLALECAHLADTVVRSPVSVVVLLEAVAVVGLHVALGPDYPGLVVFGEPLRVVVTGLVIVLAIVIAWRTPRTWEAVARDWRRARFTLMLVALAAVVSIVKVGLHDATPGPVLPSVERWVAVSAGVLVAVASTRGRGGPSRS